MFTQKAFFDLLESPRGVYSAWALIAMLSVLIVINIYSTFQHFSISSISENLPNKKKTAQQPKSLPDIAAWHLFGIYHPNPLATSKLPRAALSMTLVGVFTAIPGQTAHAIIASSAGRQKLYIEGEPLAQGMKIYKILSDRVILERDNQFAVLPLQQKKLSFSGIPKSLFMATGKR